VRPQWLRRGASQPLAGPHGFLLWLYSGLVAVGAPAFLLIYGEVLTIWANMMTIFGSGVNAPSRVSATDPTFLMGANGTDPAKLAINSVGRALISATTPMQQREVSYASPMMYVGLSVAETFLGITNLEGNLATTSSTGSAASQVVNGRVGVIRLSASTTATNNARAYVGYGSSDNCLTTVATPMHFVCVLAPSVALYSGGSPGRIVAGFSDTDGTALPQDAAWFRSDNGGDWQCQTRLAGMTTTVATSIALSLGAYKTFAISLTSTLAQFWVDGELVASITSTLPSGADLTGIQVGTHKTSAHVINGSIDVDLIKIFIPSSTVLA